ncbi:MAG: hypothetical protein KQI81_14370 [Deltaproteobacteria bacterium]|nr:hypothetical protein [Deltaproteobacteria bacterium]
MFQNEARFGRMSDPMACRAPSPHRPVVNLALVREFRYEYAAISPWDGCLDYMTTEKMNTENMSQFLYQIWNVLRRNHFANRFFDSLDAATAQAELGLAQMAANKESTRQLTNWPWISAILKA